MKLSDFIKKAQKVHGDKYDYSKVEYVNNRTKVCIICPEHGEFWQIPSSHLIGKGCKLCFEEKKKHLYNNTQEVFIKRCQSIHGDKYDYSKVEYINAKSKICIICPEHGEFWQVVDSHMRGNGCPVCGNSLSTPENQIYSFLKENTNFEIEQRNRQVIKPYELDLYIPDKNIAIEFNGIYWHSSKFIDNKNKHLQKLKLCKTKNIKLIQVFEDEWYDNKEIVLSKIRHLIDCNYGNKIMARKTNVKEIDTSTAKEFLLKYHIQGYGISSKHLGCYYQNQLIAVMTFKRISNNSNDWELTRFASDYNYICCGVGGKLFKHFIREYNPNSVKSFADRRWTVDEENNVYIQLGFKFDGYTPPDYKYVIPNESKRYHKFNFRKKYF